MTRVAELHKKWLKDPAYKAAYDGLEDEFAAAARTASRGRGDSGKPAFRFVIVRRGPRDFGWQVLGPDGSPEAGAFGFLSREAARKAIAAFKLGISRAPIADAAA